MTSGVTYYILLIHFFSGSEIDPATSDSIFILLSFVLPCSVCVHPSETLTTLKQVTVPAVLCSELPKCVLTIAIVGELQMALPCERLSDKVLNFENK